MQVYVEASRCNLIQNTEANFRSSFFRVVIPLCGGNIDTTVLGRCLERGLAADGRLVKFTVTVTDRPGGIAELAKTLAQCGVSIKDMVHERAWIKNDIFSVEVGGVPHSQVFVLGIFFKDLFQVIVVVETRSVEHAGGMFRILKTKYTHMTVMGVGGAFGLRDRADSGQDSQGSFAKSDDEDLEPDLTEDETNKFLAVAKELGKRRSKQFSVCEMTLDQ